MQIVLCPHALIKNGDKYLITQRSSNVNFAPDEWDIPGGHFKPGEEDIVFALKRKVNEEIGFEPNVSRIIYLFQNTPRPAGHYFQAVYECNYNNETITVNHEGHSEYKWVTVEEMLKLPLMKFLRSLAENILLKTR